MYFFTAFNAAFSICCNFLQLWLFLLLLLQFVSVNCCFIKQTIKVTIFLLLSDIEKIICKIMLFQFTHIFSTVLSQFFCFYALWKLQKEINTYCKLCSANLLLCCVALVNFSKETLKSFYQATVLTFNFKLVTRPIELQRCFKTFPCKN